MSKFIIIELDENEDYEIQADHIRNVAQLVDDGFICGLDKQARFETINTLNHNTLSDVIKAIRKYPNVHPAIHSLHGRITNGADIDQAIEWLYEEIEE